MENVQSGCEKWKNEISDPSNSTEYHPDSDKALSPKMNSEPEPPNDIHTAVRY